MPVTIGGSGPITGVTSINTTVSDTELGYLDGVTSAIQSQINTAGGLVKITDQSFSAASSVSVNNCFSSTYDNYRVIFSATGSAAQDILLRLRAAGSDNTTSNYDSAVYRYTSTNSAGGMFFAGSLSNFQVVKADTTGRALCTLDIGFPALAQYTRMSIVASHPISGTATVAAAWGAHGFLASTTFDGFTLYTSTGTMSGEVRVYGYRN